MCSPLCKPSFPKSKALESQNGSKAARKKPHEKAPQLIKSVLDAASLFADCL